MHHKPARSKYAILQQVCQLIPPYLVARLAKEHGVDKQARTFSPWSHVVALLYAQLVHSLSLEDVCDALRHHSSKLFTIREATPPSRNAFSHANRKRSATMAEALFWEVYNHLTSLTPQFAGKTYKRLPRRFKRVIYAMDSTTIQLVANCMDWARHRRKKAAAKMHLRLNLQCFLPAFAIVDSARGGDSSYARRVCAQVSAGEIVVFDKAYVDFVHLRELDERGVFWVTRAKKNMAYRVVRRRPGPQRSGNILHDEEIELTDKNSRPKYPGRLRRVVALVEVNGNLVEMTFLTNNMEWAATSIADLYKCRWAIEVFFKEIKQTLQLCDFVGHNKSAIQWQVWTALLLHLLLRYLAFAHSWTHGFKRLFCLVRATIWDMTRLDELLKFCGTANGRFRMNATVNQAYFPGFKALFVD